MNLYDTKLLQELLDYGSEKDREYLGAKAHRLYYKCLRNGKDALAAKIHDKYYPFFIKVGGDSGMAFGFYLSTRK